MVFTHALLVADGWYVGKFTPAGVFHHRSRSVLLLLLVAGSAMGVCIAPSVLMARNLSGPLERIVGAASALLPVGRDTALAPGRRGDLYASLNELAVEMESLHRLVQLNRPILRHQLLTSLLHGTAGTHEEIGRRLELVGVQTRAATAVCLLFEFHPRAFAEFALEAQSYLLYDAIERMERPRGSSAAGLAGQLERHRVGAVLRSSGSPCLEAGDAAQQLGRELRSPGDLRYSIAVGSEARSVEDLPESYRAALSALRYRFLLPGRLPLRYDETRGWDQRSCPSVDGGEGALRRALHTGRAEPVREWLRGMERLPLDEHNVPSLDGVLLSLAVTARELLEYGERICYEFDRGERENLESLHERFDTLRDFASWLEGLAERMQLHHESRVGMARQIRAVAVGST